MGFRYLNRVASEENIPQFLELADLAAGAGASAENVFLLSTVCGTRSRCSSAAAGSNVIPTPSP